MSVVLKSRWPIHSCSARIGTPAAAMRVPKVWRRSWKRTSRRPARRAAPLKPLQELRSVQRFTKVGMAENQIIVAGVVGLAVQNIELDADAVGQRDGAGR